MKVTIWTKDGTALVWTDVETLVAMKSDSPVSHRNTDEMAVKRVLLYNVANVTAVMQEHDA